MENGDMSHHNMGGLPPPPPETPDGMDMHRKKLMMHMTFFWGKDTEVLFSGWPDNDSGMYALALIFVFVLAVLVECLTHSRLNKSRRGNVAAGLIQTAVFGVRAGLAYLVMLSVMSFNGGVYLAAVLGHAVGFLVFGSRVFRKSVTPKEPDVSPMKC